MKPARSSTARLRWSLAWVVALGTCAGCLVIPTPEFNSGNARANINKNTAAQFEPGRTTRADVILMLGEPDAVSADERQLGYRSEKICGFWFVGAYYSGTGGVIPRDRYLVFHFDPQGRLEKAERSVSWVGSTGVDKVLPDTDVGEGYVAGEEICQRHPGRWYPQLDGFRDKHWEQVAGCVGHLLLTHSNLVFVTRSQFANTPPELSLSYASLAESRLDNYFLGRRLVVRSHTGEVHSFEVYGPKGTARDRKAAEEAFEFLKSKVESLPAAADPPGQTQKR